MRVCETTAWGQIEVNRRWSLKSVRHLLQVGTGDIPDRTGDHSPLVTYDRDVAAVRSESRVFAASVLSGEVQIDTAASVNAGGKRALIVNTGDLWEKRTTETTAATSGCCTQCVKGRPAAPSVVGLFSSISYPILSGHRKWKVSASPCRRFCLSGCVCQRWARRRFNYAVIECDSLITKREMWGVISMPGVVGSAQDGRTNRHLE